MFPTATGQPTNRFDFSGNSEGLKTSSMKQEAPTSPAQALALERARGRLGTPDRLLDRGRMQLDDLVGSTLEQHAIDGYHVILRGTCRRCRGRD